METTRREMIATASTIAAGAAGTAFAANAAESGTKSAFYELRYYRMRTDHTEQGRRTAAFLTSGYLPAAKKAGAGLIGLFGSVIAPESPFILCLTSYPSLDMMETVREKLAASEEYQKALADYNSGEPGFVRMESWLLRAFDFFPGIELTPAAADGKRPPRIYELRTYQALQESYAQRKIKMFGSGEVEIFRSVGLQPVWFGQALVGANLPHLTYMVAFENMAARDVAWNGFRAHPKWLELQRNPEFSMPGLSSNISNSILSAMNGSEIR